MRRLESKESRRREVVCSPPRLHGYRFLQADGLRVCVDSGIHAAIDGKIRPGHI